MVLLLQDQSKVRWMGVVTLALSTLSVTFLFLFLLTLPLRCCSLHVAALLATNVGSPINAQVLRASSFCIRNQADCSNCWKHFLPTGIKTFFFLLFCALCTIINRCIILSTFLYKKCSLQDLLESKRTQSRFALCKTYCSLKGKPPSCTSLLWLEFVCQPNQKRGFSSRGQHK